MRKPTHSSLVKKLGKFMRASHSISPTSGDSVANEIIIHFENGEIFQSYDSIIAYKINGLDKIYLTYKYDYSKTTMKYLNYFLRADSFSEIRKMIEDGKAVVID